LEIVGDIIMIAGVLFMLFGVIGIFKFKNFYLRILVTTKIDTVGALTLFIGMAIKHGFSFFSLKVVLLVILMMILNPLATHMVARSAFLSDYNIESSHTVDDQSDEEDDI